MRRISLVLAFTAGVASGFSGAAAGQDPDEEARLLRAAAARESRGDLAGAEAVLRELLDRVPTSSGGVFALERVLRSRGRVREVLPAVDRYLEQEPASAGPSYLKLRVLVELDSLEAVDTAAEAWIEADPRSPDPYKEVARIYERALGPERALDVLRRGQDAVGDSALLAVETGDALLALGRDQEALREWSRAVGDDGAQAAAVLRRVAELEGDRRELVQPLVDLLGREPTTVARQRTAAQLAVEVGLESEAVRMAERVSAGLSGRPRRSFLTDLARRSDEAGAGRVSLWAYSELRQYADGAEARALDERIVAAALAEGDTALARTAQDRVASAFPRGSPERRRALAFSIRLGASEQGVARVRERVKAFREEFPAAPELDALAAALAWDFLGRGQLDEAEAVLEGVEGPRSQVERAYLHFARGDIEAGRQALIAGVGGLPARGATDVIELSSVLQDVAPAVAEVIATASVDAHRGREADAVRALADAVPEVPTADRPALLFLAARYADDGGREDQAADLRVELINRFPDDPRVPEATVTLARYYAGRPEEVGRAVELLEDLILTRPESPIVPHARRELQRLRGRVPTEHHE